MAWSGEFDDLSFGCGTVSTTGKWVSSNEYNNTEFNSNPIKTGTTTIGNLVLGVNNITVVGVVIAKEGAKAISSRKNPGTERHLISFTLRDSANDFINATCWGGSDYVQQLSGLFHIGDVIEINNPQIQSKPQDGSDERFRPWTSSPYQMSISENHSTVKLYGGWNADSFDKLKHIPVKPSNDYYTLEDVLTNGQNLDKEHISLLTSVKYIGQAKDIVTKTGRHTCRCEVKLFDETCSSFPLVIWDHEQVELVQTWTPKDCVIFAADVKVTYDDFRKSMIATADCKTVFTLNPDTREAHSLYRYAQSVEFDDKDWSGKGMDGTVNLESIKDVSTIEEIKEGWKTMKDNLVAQCGIVFAYITSMNLDGDEGSLYSTKCVRCKQRVSKESQMCINLNCPASLPDPAATEELTEQQWNVIVSISDVTGTIDNCLLSAEVAEKLLGCSIKNFLGYTEKQRTELKWHILLEKCKIFFKVVLPTSERSKPFTRLLSCCLADPVEAVTYLH